MYCVGDRLAVYMHCLILSGPLAVTSNAGHGGSNNCWSSVTSYPTGDKARYFSVREFTFSPTFTFLFSFPFLSIFVQNRSALLEPPYLSK